MAVPDRTVKRLQSDYRQLLNTPVEFVSAHPLDENILEWYVFNDLVIELIKPLTFFFLQFLQYFQRHYVIRGPPDSSYEGGLYHGKLVFPKEYPMKPPAIYMITPNGKFQVNVRLCLTISDYHP